jgi:hypothetical protein
MQLWSYSLCVRLLALDQSTRLWQQLKRSVACFNEPRYVTIHPYVLKYNSKNSARSLLCTASSSVGTTTLSWVSACSTIVEHSQQEGFTECRCQRHVKPPTWRRTRDLERSNFRHKRPPASETTLANPAAEGGTMGEKWQRILPKVATSTSLLVSFTRRKAWHGTDGFTSPPTESVLRIFLPKNPKASAGFELAYLGTKGQHATSRPPKPLYLKYYEPKSACSTAMHMAVVLINICLFCNFYWKFFITSRRAYRTLICAHMC